MFGKFGKLHSVEIVWDKQDRSTGEAFIVFEKPKDAAAAIESLNQGKVQHVHSIIVVH